MSAFEKKIEYTFKDRALLREAFTHSSYTNEKKGGRVRNYERLEFLGDSILGFVTAEFLYDNFAMTEGELTKVRSTLVCEQHLASVADRLGIGEQLILGRGEEMTHGRTRPSILADVVEALIAAIYLDGGMGSAAAFVRRFILDGGIDEKHALKSDYKTSLQEIVQRDKSAVLAYSHIGESGPDHDKVFICEAVVNGKTLGRGSGHSKKEAEQAAARAALSELEI